MGPTTDPHDEEAALPHIDWTPPGVHLQFRHDEDSPLRLTRFVGVAADACLGDGVPLVEVLAVGLGHTLANDRLVQTSIGAALRYRSHAIEDERQAGDTLVLQLATAPGPRAVSVEVVLRAADGAVRVVSTVHNTGSAPLVLTAVTSWVSGVGRPAASTASTARVLDAADWSLVAGTNDWLGEGRWSTTPLRGDLLPDLHESLTGNTPRSAVVRTAVGTWSTGGDLPVAALSSPGLTWLWEIEHNGPWRWEVGQHIDDCYLALSGPTDRDHQWSLALAPDETFTTVPVTVTLGADLPTAVAALTGARRRNRVAHPDNTRPSIVFNDYMNTLDGDPTTAKLLPLVAAAARVGADTFCIDAGWYSDAPDWWDTVGAWQPSTTRFPNGLAEVSDAIRAAGMTPGLWLEPEVVGVDSPVADTLPPEAFLQRRGQRVEEHRRFHLDLRHPAARAHLDAVVDRLVQDFGIGFFKLDYNIDGGPGTDRDADSVGMGLLEHNRAHQAWLDEVIERHPTLVLENCSSGAMRMDAALLSRTQLQSTSDQQDPMRYPPIAASAGLSMLPEQAANWAYPQPDLTDEQNAFTLVTGLSGRFYLSGHLDRMTDDQLDLVCQAVSTARDLHRDLADGTPAWPLGLPGWTDRWVAAARHAPDRTVVSVWDRGTGVGETELRFPELAGRDLRVTTIFPRDLPTWQAAWDATTGTLSVRSTVTPPTARTLTLTPTAPSD
ncbi:glycoside hydrolase family 36 protein [Curtobacterium sp. VKM Ac-2922]|uniref:glycoside hydrolase family 36 protein n=1 Tax=Curtobacterium sp. VKM Ac-2922 TaxID=2929475 RepID=UPI001FB3D7D1|nr:glycoside hydrolase family 36 protein [Curtobacterium sp. VKM Ac-2922]MCJ1715827.1 alpha-galactosidase [Curtobacterium sp. VKM Ac-2922]